MPLLFLYGQTIKPIELHIQGSYTLIIFQLYPFVLKSFFNVTAKDINDNCYDLQQLPNMANQIRQLLQSKKIENRIENMTNFLFDMFKEKKETLDFTIRNAILLILDKKGQTSNLQLCQNLHITERTLERRFLSQVGISPKQFSQIIQFQQSFEQLTLKEFTNLTEIVYTHGFADQSHFIRVFKAFTGKTPKKFAGKKG
jgi:AraC-like DNA-binding protein